MKCTIIIVCLLGSFAAAGRIQFEESEPSQRNAETDTAFMDSFKDQFESFEVKSYETFEEMQRAAEKDNVDFGNVTMPFNVTAEPDFVSTEEPSGENPALEEEEEGVQGLENLKNLNIAAENDAAVRNDFSIDLDKITIPFEQTTENPATDA